MTSTIASNTKTRRDQRNFMIKVYRGIPGKNSIPENRQFWNVNGSGRNSSAEISFFVDEGLITKSQFQQTRDTDTIAKRYDAFKPALIHFNPKVVMKKSHEELAMTMNLCPPDTILIASLVLSDD